MFTYGVSDVVLAPSLYQNQRLAVLSVTTGRMDEDPRYVVQLLEGGSTRSLHETWLRPIRFSKEERARAMELVGEYEEQLLEMERGLYSKYRVLRAVDEVEVPTAMFVLDRRDPAALVAMIAYARATSSAELRKDLLLLASQVLADTGLRWYRTNHTEESVQELLYEAINELSDEMRKEIIKETQK